MHTEVQQKRSGGLHVNVWPVVGHDNAGGCPCGCCGDDVVGAAVGILGGEQIFWDDRSASRCLHWPVVRL